MRTDRYNVWRLASVVAITLALVSSAAGAQEAPPTAQVPPPIPETATEPDGLIEEPPALERAVIFMDRHFASGETSSGFYVDFANMIPGAGWLSGGPGYRLWSNEDRVFLDSSAAISWRGYKTAQARAEFPRLFRSRLLVGTQYKWQDFTQVSYFGEGATTPESDRSEYHLRTQNLVAYASIRPRRWLAIDGLAGWLKPSLEDGTFGTPTQPAFIHREGSITADTRDFHGHPTRGSVLRAAVANFADRDVHAYSFNRYEAEAAYFQPFAASRVVLALHGWLVTTDTDDGQSLPFYLLPSLGGHNSLRGYADYRFHDRNLMLVNVEARVAMMRHVDAAVFVDAGNVAGRVGALNVDKRSWGGGLRVHSRRQTFARLDVARGEEGWRVVFRLTDPLNLSRLSRRTALIPFVP